MFAYFDVIRSLLSEAETRNAAALGKAADEIATCLQQGGLLHTFGTGHGHMLAEEIFYRAGGLVPVNAILDPPLMLHLSALSSTQVERLSGYAEVILDRYEANRGDVIIIASNSGRNSVPIEMALAAQARGLTVIALTSLAHSQAQPSRHASGKRLFEIADIVLDNCGQVGDAALTIEGLPGKIGATSTVIGAALLHALVCTTIQKMIERGTIPPVTTSSNVAGGDAHNAELYRPYRNRIRHL
jgi:uncharacterized phosphosugar-binding protein